MCLEKVDRYVINVKLAEACSFLDLCITADTYAAKVNCLTRCIAFVLIVFVLIGSERCICELLVIVNCISVELL